MNCNSPVSRAPDYQLLFNVNPAQQLILKADSPYYTIVDMNEAFLSEFKKEYADLAGKSLFSAFPENPAQTHSYSHAERRKKLDSAVLSKKPVSLTDYRFDVQLGTNSEFTERYWSCIYTPITGFDGRVAYIIASNTDVTEKYLAQNRQNETAQALKIEREQNVSLFMQAPLPIGILKGPNFIVNLVNEPLCLLYGKTQAELIGKPIFEVLGEASGKGYEELLREVMQSGKAYKGNNAQVPLIRNGMLEQVYFNFVYEPYREQGPEITGVFVIGFEVTEEVKNKQKLEESEAKFRFMTESLPQQIWSANAEGSVDFVNNCTATYFGKNKSINGEKWITDTESWFNYIHLDDLSQCIDAWMSATRSGESFQTKMRLLRADGTYRWHLSLAVPFKTDDKIVKWLGTNTDIEDFKQLEVRKDEFISIASHELKTPMTSLKGYMQLLADNSFDVKNRKYVDRSLNQIYRIEKLISDLLDVSKITSGKINYDMNGFDFQSLLTETIQNLKLTNVSHEIVVTTSPQAQIYGDRDRIEQVLINFLTNAIKYSPEANQIIINTAIIENRLVVSIQDFGIGISKAHDSRVFDRFYRVDYTAMLYPGLGLGLYVSAEIISRHGGSYWYESEPEIGSVFYFDLPLMARY